MNHRFSVLCALLLVACGGGDSDVDLDDRDPRCISACPETMPRYENVGAVCNAASRNQCLDECEARIAGVSPICQSCLVEHVCFDPSCDEGTGYVECQNNTCTIHTSYGECQFDDTNDAQKRKCYEQVDPRREVTCTAEFRPTTQCATVCP